MSFCATFHLTFFDPVQRSRIDKEATFLVSSGSESSINQDVKFAIMGFSSSLADRPTQLGYERVAGIEIAHAVIPGEEVLNRCCCFQ